MVLLIRNRNVLHHTHRIYRGRDGVERIGGALSQANIEFTKTFKKHLIVDLKTVETFRLPEDMTIVYRVEENGDVVLLGPVREDKQKVVDGLKRLVDRALD